MLLLLVLLLLLLLLEVVAFVAVEFVETGPENDEMLLFPKVLLLIWFGVAGDWTGVLVLVLFRACDLRNGEF